MGNTDWNSEPLLKLPPGSSPSIQIPFVNSGKDKIFYVIEHNSSWGPGVLMTNIQQTDGTYKQLGGLFTSFNNPFSRHFNSKLYQRYYGVIVPKNLLPTDKNFITIRIDMPTGLSDLLVREVGTHDYNPKQL